MGSKPHRPISVEPEWPRGSAGFVIIPFSPFGSCGKRLDLVKYQAKQMNSTSKILKAVFLLGSLIAFSALTSCETISGFGRDLQYASQAAQNR